MATIDSLLALSEADLLKQCKVEFYKSGGPGGQKRNKTSSAAKITHLPTGVESHSNDFRSQAENRTRALHRLRFKIAAGRRTSIQTGRYEPPTWIRCYVLSNQLHVNPRNHDYARLAAHTLDLLAARHGKVADVAALIGASNSSVVKFLKQQHEIWDAACQIRKSAGLNANPFPQ